MESIKKELKCFQDLKNLSLPSPEDSLEDLIKKKDIYDINPNTNYSLLSRLIELSHEDLVKNFYEYNQTLTFFQRKDIIDKLENTYAGKIIAKKIGLSKESYIEKYFSILNELKNFCGYKSLSKFKKIKHLFKTTYFVDNKPIKIPLIYGTKQLKYSGLINNLYQCLFFINKDNQINTKEKEINNTYNEKEKIKVKNKDKNKNQENSSNYPENIIKYKDTNAQNNNNIPANNNQNDELNIKSMDIENNDDEDREEDVDEDEDEDEIFDNFKDNIVFIADYLNIICDDEFLEFFNVKNQYNLDESQKFVQEYQLNPDIDSLFYHLLFFDLLITINFYHGNSNFDKSLKYIFFEKKEIKSIKLKVLRKFCKIFLIQNNKEITFKDSNDVTNQDYIMIDLIDQNKTFIFNPYDYIFSNFNKNSITEFQDIVNTFNNPKNYSLYKIFKNNNLFNDQNLFESFKENIMDMLSSNVINQLYNQFENYKGYKNPYQGDNKDKFIKQTFDIILYMPIPFEYIAGFTYKNYGIIFLNTKEPLKRNALPNTYFLKQICNVSFKKVVIIHEIICHFCASLVHGNDISYELKTPPNTFIDYCPMEDYINTFSFYDGGEKGESILFGNKIHNIFIKGALYILNNENFEKNLDDFRAKFIELNNPKNCTDKEFNVNEESRKNKIIFNIRKKTEDIDDLIKITKSNSIHSFRIFSSEDDDEQIFEDGVLYVKRLTHKDITFKPRKINK